MARPSKIDRVQVLNFIEKTFNSTGKTPTYKDLVKQFGGSNTTHLRIISEWEEKRNADSLSRYHVEASDIGQSFNDVLIPIFNNLLDMQLQELLQKKQEELGKTKQALAIACDEHEADQAKIEELDQRLRDKETEITKSSEAMVEKLSQAYCRFDVEKQEMHKQLTEMKVHYELLLAEERKKVMEWHKALSEVQHQLTQLSASVVKEGTVKLLLEQITRMVEIKPGQ